jgi:hypothetical protein
LQCNYYILEKLTSAGKFCRCFLLLVGVKNTLEIFQAKLSLRSNYCATRRNNHESANCAPHCDEKRKHVERLLTLIFRTGAQKTCLEIYSLFQALCNYKQWSKIGVTNNKSVNTKGKNAEKFNRKRAHE